MKRVLAIVSSLDDPSARFRFDPYVARFAARDVDLERIAWPADRAARRDLIASVADYESVVLLRRLLSPGDVRRLGRAAKRFVYEYDDAMPLRDSARGASPSWSRRRKFRAAVDAADAIVAGNHYLAAFARPRDATVVPTVVTPPVAPPLAAAPGGSRESTPVVGWLGTAANFPYLESITASLAAAHEASPFRLMVMAERSPEIDAIPFDFHPWSLEAEADFLRALDVGIMPLFDDAWCRGKCGLKALQYMAAGCPVVSSAVRGPGDVVGDGGVLCPDAESWRDTLIALIEDPVSRGAIGEVGREHVARHYSPDVWSDRLLALYLGIDPEADEGATR